MPTAPSDLTYGYVRGRYVLAAGDTISDANRVPDVRAASGTVRFRWLGGAFVASEPVSTAVVPLLVDATIDPNTGDLLDEAGASGVWLVAGRYEVTFRFVGVSVPTFEVLVTAAHTFESPLELPAHAPLLPAPGERFIVNEQVYRDTLAAAERAERAAEQGGGVPPEKLEADLATKADQSADLRGGFLTVVTDGGTYHHNSDLLATAETSATYKTKHQVFTDATRPTLVFTNSSDLPLAPGAGAGSPLPYTMSASLIGADGVIYRARVGGSLTWTLAAGQAVETDPIENLTLVRGTSIYALTYVSTPVPNGWRSGYLITNAAVVADGIGRVYGSNATATGAGITGTPSTGAFYAYSPTAIRARATVPARAVAIVADSIGFGAGAGQAAYQRSFVLDALRNGRVPYVQFSRSGSTLYQANNSPTPLELSLAGSLTTDAILELATNDFSNSRTAAQVQADSLAQARALRANGVKRVWRTTTTPRSSGTVGAQVPSGLAARQTFNAWCRAGAPVDAITLQAVAVGTAGALLAGQGAHPFAGILDLAALVEDGVTGTWKAPFYGDGIHPTDSGHIAMEAGVRPDLFGGSTNSPKNYLSSYFPKKIYSAAAGAALTTSRLYFVPFHVSDAPVRVDRLAVNCTNAGSAEGIVRTAIYIADATGRPATLVTEIGAKAPSYGITYNDLPSPLTLQPGRYFMSIVSQGAPATPPLFISGTGADPLVTGDLWFAVPASNAYILNAVPDGPLPVTISSSIYSTTAPMMQLRAV